MLTPKTVVSLAVWLLMFGLGAGLSGLILFAVYQSQVNNLRTELLESQEELKETLEERIANAPAARESPSMNVSETGSVDPLKELVESTAPAIVGVIGRDAAGKQITGSGFAVNSTDDGTWVLTSYRLVAGVKTPSELSIRHKNSQLVGEVYESDPARDLALVIYHVRAERSLRFSRIKDPKEGDQVWAIGNVRNQPYAAGLSARLTSVSSSSLGIDIQVPSEYLGGPLLDADGRVLGVLTSGPGGTATAATPAPASGGAATPIDLACQRVLVCPSPARSPGAPASGPTPTRTATPPARPRPQETLPPPPDSPPEEPPPPVEPGAVTEPPPSNPNTADVPIG